MTLRSSLGLSLAVVLAMLAVSARAQPLVTIGAEGGAPLTAPQSRWFSPGAAAAAGVYYPVKPFFLVGGKLRAGLLTNGDKPSDPGQVDPGTGTFETLELMLRLRPFARTGDARSAPGLFVEAGGGGVLTGKLVRSGLEAGVGYGFALGHFTLAPTLGYLQVIEPSNALSGNDARLLMFGAELAVLDTRPTAEAKGAEPPPAPKDRDDDGVPDAEDACPDTPEDRDGFQDEDGCPDPDNDGDKIPDAVDSCPNEPEDMDGFEDKDGCPDPDNDHDGFLDKDDQCPNEAEVINGNKDYDGCPDTGLIEMRNDRIVLEERVLFDFERARVKSAAKPVLAAIVHLYKQHPEWMKIRIEGHADQRGREEYNQELSEQRAQNVRDELVKLGIPDRMIESAGYGSKQPRDLRQEEDAYQRNRRVEFVVVARSEQQAASPAAGASTPAASKQPSKAAASSPAAPKPAAAAPPKAATPTAKPDATPAAPVAKPAPPSAVPAAKPAAAPAAPAAKPAAAPSAPAVKPAAASIAPAAKPAASATPTAPAAAASKPAAAPSAPKSPAAPAAPAAPRSPSAPAAPAAPAARTAPAAPAAKPAVPPAATAATPAAATAAPSAKPASATPAPAAKPAAAPASAVAKPKPAAAPQASEPAKPAAAAPTADPVAPPAAPAAKGAKP